MKLVFNGNAMKDIVENLRRREIDFTITNTDGEIEVEGFSKSSICRIVEDEKGTVTAYTRYGQEDVLESFRDLVALNYEWFDAYRNREPFTSPSYLWADTLEEFGYVSREVNTIIKYK